MRTRFIVVSFVAVLTLLAGSCSSSDKTTKSDTTEASGDKTTKSDTTEAQDHQVRHHRSVR